MIIALTSVILLVTTVAILILRLLKPGFAYHWLIAVLGALLVWPMLLFSSVSQQVEIRLALWEPHSIFPASPAFFLDQISWSFSLALATLLLSSILIGVARSADPAYPRPTWLDLASLLALTCASLLAVCAGNLLSLLLVWTMLDLIELGFWLSKVDGETANQRLVLTFFGRIVSQVLLLWAVIIARSNLLEISITSLDQTIIPFLLLAVAVRLGILPVSTSNSSRLSLRPGLLPAFNLIPIASSLVLLCRIATVGAPSNWTMPFMILAALAAVYGSLNWVIQTNGREDQTYWVITLGALAFAAALRMQPGACQALGIALLLTGGLLFHYSIRPLWLLPVILLGALSLAALPWTPTWAVVQLYSAPFQPIMVIFLFSQALVLAGYLRHALQTGQKSLGLERWVWALYIWGLVLLILGSLLITWRPFPSGQDQLQVHPRLVDSWLGLFILILAGMVLLLTRYKTKTPEWSERIRRVLQDLEWPYPFLWRLLGIARYFFKWTNTLLESQAGILWAFLLLVLLLTLFSSANLGG